MAYDRYDNRSERGWRGRDSERGYGRGSTNRDDDRGFFERAGDEIASWFGDDEAEQRRRQDERMENRDYGRNRDYDRGYGRDYDRDRQSFRSSQRDYDRDRSSARPMNWTSSDSDYRSSSPRSSRGYDRMGYGGQDRDFTSRGGLGGSMSSDYMSPTGPSFGYGGSYGAGSSSGYGSGGFGASYGSDRNEDRGRSRDYRPMTGDYGRSDTQWGRDDYRNTSYAGSNREHDRHYHAWRQRQLDDLDRDYDHYCREKQDRFENDFGSWRSERMNKRQRLGQVREHMDVVGSDGESIGKVDKVRGDHIVLTKSDSDDNKHHSIDCSMVETIEGDQIRLNMPAEEAKSRLQEGDNRGLFGRDDNDRDQHTNLDRAFSGTYES